MTAGAVAAAVDAVEGSATGTLEGVEEQAVGEIGLDRRPAVAPETRTVPLRAIPTFRGADREDLEEGAETHGADPPAGQHRLVLEALGPHLVVVVQRVAAALCLGRGRGPVGAEGPSRGTEGRGSDPARQDGPFDRVAALHQE